MKEKTAKVSDILVQTRLTKEHKAKLKAYVQKQGMNDIAPFLRIWIVEKMRELKII